MLNIKRNENMYSTDAIKRAVTNPEYTLKAMLAYPSLKPDIQYITKQLNNNFTQEERARYAHGASAGLKECVLYALVRHYKPELMIETGVAQGVSTYFILKAMHENRRGKLISIDEPNYNPKGYIDNGGNRDNVYIPKGRQAGWLVPEEYRYRWNLLIGRSNVWLPRINDKIDMFFHDSDHSYKNMKYELVWAMAHMYTGVIIADDTSRNTAWIEISNKYGLRQISSPISAAEFIRPTPAGRKGI